jgi:hypothetical protein
MTVRGCRNCCILSAVDETVDDVLWNDSEDGDVRSECEEDTAVEMETVTLIGKGR